MKKIYLLGVVVVVSFVLLQSAEAYPRGASRSYSSAPHFSAPSYRSAPSRSFSSAPARFSPAPRFQNNRSFRQSGPRISSTTALRNSAYLNRARFGGDRTAAFNSRSFSRSTARLTAANRTRAVRSQGFDRGRVIARYSANWRRNWDRSRDHNWRGHRCHFRNGFWFIYDPFPFYPYGYGFYPYGAYYDSNYYDDGSYAADQYATETDRDQTESDGGSRVTDVQSALAREGYYDGAIDGRLGPATQKALRRFQRDHGLDATGGINSAVIEALRLR
jgi:hypothetical protein